MAEGHNVDGPPPTLRHTDGEHDDGYLHRRSGERVERRHQRWYDSTKVHLAIVTTLLGLLGGALAIGYSVRDFTRSVEGSAGMWAEQQHTNRQMRAGLDSTAKAVERLEKQDEALVSVLLEIRCTLQADGTQARRRCSDEEAARRLRQLQRGQP